MYRMTVQRLWPVGRAAMIVVLSCTCSHGNHIIVNARGDFTIDQSLLRLFFLLLQTSFTKNLSRNSNNAYLFVQPFSVTMPKITTSRDHS